jgi:hypothetical protein
MAQSMRPISQVTATNGVPTTNVHLNLDGTAPDSGNYYAGADNATGVCEVLLTDLSATTPADGTCTVIIYEAQCDGTVAPSSGGTAPTFDLEVYEGATQRASVTGVTPTESAFTLYNTLTFDASTITDWANVRVRFTSNGTGGAGPSRRGAAVSYVEITTPDASTDRDVTQGTSIDLTIATAASTVNRARGASGTTPNITISTYQAQVKLERVVSANTVSATISTYSATTSDPPAPPAPAGATYGSIVRKIPWTRQPPPGVQIDKGNPLSRGLVGVFNAGTEVTQNQAGNYGSNKTLGAGPTGRGALYDTTNVNRRHSFLSTDIPDGALSNADGLSVVVVANVASVSGTNQSLLGIMNNTDTTARGWYIHSDYNSDNIGFTVFGVAATDSGISTPIGSDFTTVFTWDGSNTTYRVQEGGTITTASGSVSTGTGGIDGYHIGCFQKNTTEGPFAPMEAGGVIYATLIYNRVLSSSEKQSISENPWQIFQPRTQIIPTFVPAAQTYGVVPRKIPWTRKPDGPILPQIQDQFKTDLLRIINPTPAGMTQEQAAGWPAETFSWTGTEKYTTLKDGSTAADFDDTNHVTVTTTPNYVAAGDDWTAMWIGEPNHDSSDKEGLWENGTFAPGVYQSGSTADAWGYYWGGWKNGGSSDEWKERLSVVTLRTEGSSGDVELWAPPGKRVLIQPADASSWSAANLRFGACSGGSHTGKAKMGLWLLWLRRLSNDEMRRINDDPWGTLFKPQTQYLPTAFDTPTETFGVIKREIPWTREPPSGTKINWGHPLAQGLKFLGPHGDYYADAVSGQHGRQIDTADSTTGYYNSKYNGKRTHVSNNTSQGGMWWPSSSHCWNISENGKMTMLLHCAVDSMASFAVALGIADRESTWVFPYSALALQQNDTNGACWVQLGDDGDTSGILTDTGFWNKDGSWHWYGVRWDGTTIEALKDGSQFDSGLMSYSAWDIKTADQSRMVLFDRQSTTTATQGVDGEGAIGAVWSRVLSDEEVRSFQNNPWQIFKPQTQYIPVSFGAAAAGDDRTVTTGVPIAMTMSSLAATVNRQLNIAANTGSLSLNTIASAVNRERGISATVQALTINSLAGSVNRERGVLGTTPLLSIAPASSTVNRELNIAANLAGLTITAAQASVTLARVVAANVVALQISDYPADVNRTRNVTGTLAALTIAPLNTSITKGRNIPATTAAMTVSPLASSTNRERGISATQASLAISEYQSSVNRARGVSANTGALTKVTYASEVNRQRGVNATVVNLNITPANSVVNRDRGVDATVAALLLAAQTAAITKGRNVATSLVSLNISIQAPSVLRNRGVAAGQAVLNLAALIGDVQRGVAFGDYPLGDFISSRSYRSSTREQWAVPSSNAGDLLFCAAIAHPKDNIYIKGNWTELDNAQTNSGLIRAECWYKTASAAENTLVSFSYATDNHSIGAAFVGRFQNWDGRVPYLNPETPGHGIYIPGGETMSAADVEPPWNSTSLIVPFILTGQGSESWSVQALLDAGYTLEVSANYSLNASDQCQVAAFSKEANPPVILPPQVHSTLTTYWYRYLVVNGPNLGLITSAAAALVLQAYNSDLLRSRGVNANVPALELTPGSDQQNVNRGFNLAANAAGLTISPSNATAGRARGVNATAATMNIAPLASNINRARGVAATTATLNLATYGSTIEFGRRVNANTVGLSITTSTSTVNRALNVAATTATIGIASYRTTAANRPRNITAGLGAAISISTYSATIDFVLGTQWVVVADAAGSWSAIADATIGWSAIADAQITWERTA